MVEVVTQYKACDGKLFDSPSEAAKWENRVDLANMIVSMFPPQSNLGMGDYYLISLDTVNEARNRLVIAMKPEVGERYADSVEAFRKGVRGGLVGRILYDSDSPLYKAWCLIESIDGQGRLFNQPYYTSHPEEIRNEVSY